MSKWKLCLKNAINFVLIGVMSLGLCIPLLGSTTSQESITASTAETQTVAVGQDNESNYNFSDVSVMTSMENGEAKFSGIEFDIELDNPGLNSSSWVDGKRDGVVFKWTVFRWAGNDSSQYSNSDHVAQYAIFCSVQYKSNRVVAYWGHKYYEYDFANVSEDNTANERIPSEYVKIFPSPTEYGEYNKIQDGTYLDAEHTFMESNVFCDAIVKYPQNNGNNVLMYDRTDGTPRLHLQLKMDDPTYDASYFVQMQYSYEESEEFGIGDTIVNFLNGKKYKAITGTLSSQAYSVRSLLESKEKLYPNFEGAFDSTGENNKESFEELAYEIVHLTPTVISFSWLKPLMGQPYGNKTVPTPFATSETVNGLEVYLYDSKLYPSNVLAAINAQAERLAGGDEEKQKYYSTLSTFDCFVGAPGHCTCNMKYEYETTGVNGEKIESFKAVYYKAVHITARLSNGNSIQDSDFYLDINESYADGFGAQVSKIEINSTEPNEEGELKKGVYQYFLNEIKTEWGIDADISDDDLYGYWGSIVIPDTYTIDDIFKKEEIQGLTHERVNVSQTVSDVWEIMRKANETVWSRIWTTLANGLAGKQFNAVMYLFYANPYNDTDLWGVSHSGSLAPEDEGKGAFEITVNKELEEFANNGGLLGWLGKLFGGVISFENIGKNIGTIVLGIAGIWLLSKILPPIFKRTDKMHEQRRDVWRHQSERRKERIADHDRRINDRERRRSERQKRQDEKEAKRKKRENDKMVSALKKKRKETRKENKKKERQEKKSKSKALFTRNKNNSIVVIGGKYKDS